MKQPLRVAIADDERDMREYLEEALPRLGHQVVAAAQTGKQLVEQCRAKAPDLVITDIKMPDMDGIESSIAVNKEKQTPVILISAHDDAELLTRAAADHIMGYLVKPIKESDLKTAISLAMTRFEHFMALAREAASLRQALEDRKVIERAKGAVMKRLRVDEKEAFRHLQKFASDRNLKLKEVSQTVLQAEQVFDELERT
jgi:response regulator NasT